MKFSIDVFLIKSDQIRSFLRIWSYLLENSLMENFIFLCGVSCSSSVIPVMLIVANFFDLRFMKLLTFQ